MKAPDEPVRTKVAIDLDGPHGEGAAVLALRRSNDALTEAEARVVAARVADALRDVFHARCRGARVHTRTDFGGSEHWRDGG